MTWSSANDPELVTKWRIYKNLIVQYKMVVTRLSPGFEIPPPPKKNLTAGYQGLKFMEGIHS